MNNNFEIRPKRKRQDYIYVKREYQSTMQKLSSISDQKIG